MPAAAHVEKDGTFTNTQRLLQWHSKAVEPSGDRRSELWFTYHLGRLVRERLAGSSEEHDRPPLELTGLPGRGRARRAVGGRGAARDQRRRARRRAAVVVRGAARRRLDRVRVLDLLRGVRGRGEPRGAARCAVGLGLAARPPYALQPRVGRPEGRPWSERKRYVWLDQRRVAGPHDVPYSSRHAARLRPPPASAGPGDGGAARSSPGRGTGAVCTCRTPLTVRSPRHIRPHVAVRTRSTLNRPPGAEGPRRHTRANEYRRLTTYG